MVPLAGIVILGYVLIEAQVAAQVVGLAWLGIGVVVMVVLLVAGREARLAQEEPAKSEEST